MTSGATMLGLAQPIQARRHFVARKTLVNRSYVRRLSSLTIKDSIHVQLCPTFQYKSMLKAAVAPVMAATGFPIPEYYFWHKLRLTYTALKVVLRKCTCLASSVGDATVSAHAGMQFRLVAYVQTWRRLRRHSANKGKQN